MGIGLAFRQIMEALPEQEQKEYRGRIMKKVIKQFGAIAENEEHDILKGIGDLIEQLNDLSDSIPEVGHLMKQATSKIDELAIHIVYSENKAATNIYRLEEQLKTKQAYIEYLQKRLDDSGVGYVKE